jgi:glycosyltransferase involved in cell wall biosynthesis
MSDPLVSILMPTYRRPHYLREALASAVGQTYKNLQIIVRDNASGDETPEVVRSFNDPRIEFLQALETGSAWENGSACVARAKGKYMMPLCDDDVLGENYVETLTAFLENDAGIKAAYGATHVIDDSGAVTRKCIPNGTYTLQAGELIRSWCRGTLPLASGINYLCPASFIRNLGDTHCFPDGHNSDNAVFMAAAVQGKVLFTDQCLFYYRMHSGNSVQKHGCGLRAQGDRAFLGFLDAQVNSPRNVGLPREDWPSLRAELQAMLVRNYFHHLLRFRLHEDRFLELLRDMTIHPARAHGVRNALILLWQNRYTLQMELEKRTPGLLRCAKPFAHLVRAVISMISGLVVLSRKKRGEC